jgi:UDP-GlcNAc:undecaprenyl-phosphate GlcNAc-1-phosphate transferase
VERPLTAAATFLTAFIVSALLVRRTIPFARSRGLLDQVGPRRVNPNRLPRIAGPAILVAFLTGVAVTGLFGVDRFEIERNRIILLAAGSILLVGVTILDDIRGMGPMAKLLWQIAVAVVIAGPYAIDRSWGVVMNQVNLPLEGAVLPRRGRAFHPRNGHADRMAHACHAMRCSVPPTDRRGRLDR